EMNGEGTREPRPARAMAAAASRSSTADAGAGTAPVDEEPSGGDEVAAERPASEGEPGGTRRQQDALPLLRAAIEKLAEQGPGKPLYVRHLAQGLRGVEPGFDEQNYGFRTLTELVHLGQREGILRMQRDRQGAWRITPATGTAIAASAVDGQGE